MDDLVRIAHEIRAQDRPGDGSLAELARRQHGVVSGAQLAALGYGRGAIQHRVATERVHRVYRGVFPVGHPLLSVSRRRMAALLACGPGALLSHRSAADQHAIRRSSSPRIEVTAPRGRCGPRGVLVHTARAIHPEDHAAVDGIPTTSVARTLLDLEEVVDARALERALEEAERRRVFDLDALRRAIARSKGRRGLAPLVALLGATHAPPPATRSDLERDFLDICAELGLPPPEVNAQVAGYEVDCLWREQRVIVELDSWTWHSGRAPFERDRTRDVRLQLAEFKVLRATDRTKAEVARALRPALLAR